MACDSLHIQLLEFLNPAMMISVSRIGNQKSSTLDIDLYWFKCVVPCVQFGVDLFISRP